jgi:hypothetical protein
MTEREHRIEGALARRSLRLVPHKRVHPCDPGLPSSGDPGSSVQSNRGKEKNL